MPAPVGRVLECKHHNIGTTRMNKHLEQIEKHLLVIHEATKEEVYNFEEFKDIMGDIMLRSALALTYLEPLKEQDKRS